MKKLDSVTVTTQTGEERFLELWEGDLARMPKEETVDVLVVSVRSERFRPFPESLIGVLYQQGVSVKELADDKLVDLRESCSCWLSKEVKSDNPAIQFKYILCFEPNYQSKHPELAEDEGRRYEPGPRGTPLDLVDDIFRCLNPFIIGEMQVRQVAMPLVSTGVVGVPPSEMMEALFTSAVRWMESGLPLKRLKIVGHDPLKAAEVKGAFAILKKHHQQAKKNAEKRKPEYDIFISYSHANTQEANSVIEELKGLKPDVRIFVDHQELKTGMAWQDKLSRSIDSCLKLLALYSPEYIKSKSCQDEFNFASLLHSRNGEKTLFPIWLYDSNLLPQMKKWQYLDCREADRSKLQDACQKLVQELNAR